MEMQYFFRITWLAPDPNEMHWLHIDLNWVNIAVSIATALQFGAFYIFNLFTNGITWHKAESVCQWDSIICHRYFCVKF